MRYCAVRPNTRKEHSLKNKQTYWYLNQQSKYFLGLCAPLDCILSTGLYIHRHPQKKNVHVNISFFLTRKTPSPRLSVSTVYIQANDKLWLFYRLPAWAEPSICLQRGRVPGGDIFLNAIGGARHHDPWWRGYWRVCGCIGFLLDLALRDLNESVP